MKKMKLNVDALRVESFAVAAETAKSGTVNAHDGHSLLSCAPATCDATCQTDACACLISAQFTRCYC